MNKRHFWRGLILVMVLVSFCASAFAASYTTLRYRDSGSAVMKMQKALVALGYSTGGTDGKFGAATEKAVRQFQKDNGLTVDGLAGSATLTLLYARAEGGESSSGTSSGGSSGSSSSGAKDSYFGGNYDTLKYGSRGDRVKLLQKALNDLGFSAGTADGKFGAGTQRAVVSFQQANGLQADGLAGKRTLQKVEDQLKGDTGSSSGSTPPNTGSSDQDDDLIPSRTLRKGYQGDDVKSVQKRLKELGYYTGSVDGQYGTGTMASVKAFQSKHGLTADGLAGTRTYKILYSDNAKPAGSAVITPVPDEDDDDSDASVPSRTLRRNDTGDDVAQLQKRLKELGYYASLVDGSFGAGTETAVMAFQKQHGLDADGVAGSRTYKILFSSKAEKAEKAEEEEDNDITEDQPEASEPEDGWKLLRRGSTGTEVKQLQEALAKLNYPVGVSSEEGIVYNYTTVWAVECFQRRNGLPVDGVAGKTTLAKLYGGKAVGADTTLSSNVAKGAAPGGANLELLHWYDDLKAYLQRNREFTVYEPVSGKQWKMRLYSAGHHADSEPLTKEDSQIMYEVWGNQWSWDEKPVYVRLANGTWCIASMPNMPHLTGGISDNGFEGHTCVHFPRTMTEVQKNDPKNAARHNRDIRIHWLKLTGEMIPW